MSTIELHPTIAGAKFAREAKDKPTDWFMKPAGNGACELHYVGAPTSSNTDRRRIMTEVHPWDAVYSVYTDGAVLEFKTGRYCK